MLMLKFISRSFWMFLLCDKLKIYRRFYKIFHAEHRNWFQNWESNNEEKNKTNKTARDGWKKTTNNDYTEYEKKYKNRKLKSELLKRNVGKYQHIFESEFNRRNILWPSIKQTRGEKGNVDWKKTDYHAFLDRSDVFEKRYLKRKSRGK